MELRGVTLLEGLKERATGDYQLDLYLGDTKLDTQTVRIEPDPVQIVSSRRGGRKGRAGPLAGLMSRSASGPTPEEEIARRAAEEKRLALNSGKEQRAAFPALRALFQYGERR